MLAKRLAEKVGGNQQASQSMGSFMQIASTACAADSGALEEIWDTRADGREGLFTQVTPGAAGLLRLVITAEEHPTQMWKPPEPSSPAASVGGAISGYPASGTFGNQLTLTQPGVNFFRKLQFWAAALVPPYASYPAP